MSMQLTPAGDAAVAEIAQRYRLSDGAVSTMLEAVSRGGGSMAQFSIPELGGSGQWMRGGMTMVGDMFNSGLQATVSNLCLELATLLGSGEAIVTQAAAPGGLPGMTSRGSWWPDDLGVPSSTGGQNDTAYAYFPDAHRLAIRDGGTVTVYDTRDHSIHGVQQQQGGYGTLQFTSQYGTFTGDTLHLVGGAPTTGAPVPPMPPLPPQVPTTTPAQAMPVPPVAAQTAQAAVASAPVRTALSIDEITGAIESLANLRDKGILTEEEFTGKKAELLARL